MTPFISEKQSDTKYNMVSEKTAFIYNIHGIQFQANVWFFQVKQNKSWKMSEAR